MQEPKLLYGGAAAGGFLIEQLSTKPFHVVMFHGIAFGWIYQLLIGALTFGVGLSSFSISKERLSPSSILFFQSCDISLMVIGVYTFANINRYSEVFSLVGTWPTTAIGLWLAFVGSISLGRSLVTC